MSALLLSQNRAGVSNNKRMSRKFGGGFQMETAANMSSCPQIQYFIGVQRIVGAR
jgi:hypothetical protein